ncbi:MAG TPA: hypothetical protein VKA36_00995 [Solirubrobacterales bacterium]|nr:hypothetical protein [Solirubrobacterales bacterium]
MKRPLAALLVAGSMTLAACGSSDSDSTPTACLQGSEAYLAAVEDAPEAALVDGSVPISDCLVPGQSSGELNTVAESVIPAATRLNAEVQRRPAGEAATELGYLVGALEEGASDTAGIHTDLIRRINSAARFSDDPEGLGARFERAYGAGYQAAREAG